MIYIKNNYFKSPNVRLCSTQIFFRFHYLIGNEILGVGLLTSVHYVFCGEITYLTIFTWVELIATHLEILSHQLTVSQQPNDGQAGREPFSWRKIAEMTFLKLLGTIASFCVIHKVSAGFVSILEGVLTCDMYNNYGPCELDILYRHQYRIRIGCFWRSVLRSIFQRQTFLLIWL